RELNDGPRPPLRVRAAGGSHPHRPAPLQPSRQRGAHGAAKSRSRRDRNGLFELWVANAGEALPENLMGNLFEPFFRRSAGSGIGRLSDQGPSWDFDRRIKAYGYPFHLLGASGVIWITSGSLLSGCGRHAHSEIATHRSRLSCEFPE